MGNSHGPKLWETAVSKLFHKRSSDKEKPQLPLEPSADISEHTDGFYMYSQSVLEEEAKEREAAMAKHEKEMSESSESSFVSAVSASCFFPWLYIPGLYEED